MPKARFAHRGVPKPKSVKSRKVLNEKRQRSRFGKKQKKGLAGNAVEYISRTRAIKQLQISIRDFRRLCILKGIYPRDPPSKRHMNARQSYYHHKDVSFLAHEPLLRKFRETKSFLKKLSRAVGRRELGDARAIYERRPVYSLDHIVKERYPRFADALGDLDDALSAVHLFAGFPAAFISALLPNPSGMLEMKIATKIGILTRRQHRAEAPLRQEDQLQLHPSTRSSRAT
jgi:pescadillo protein